MVLRKWMKTAAAGLAVMLFWSLLASLGTGGSLNFVESTLQDAVRKQSDAERAPLNEIKIIKIDQASLDQLGQFPWDRALYAQVIDMLMQAGAKAVALDVVLAEPGANPESDAAMAEVMAKYPDVYLPAVFNFEATQLEKGLLKTESIVYPASTISSNGNQVGHINVFPDKDSTVRMLTVGLPDERNRMIPALSVRLANYILEKKLQIRWDETEEAWFRGDKRIPVNERYQVATEFYSKPREAMNADTGYDAQSFFDVLSGAIPPEYYQDAVVLIGPYATGLQDEYLTPLSDTLKMFGVEIHANMVQSLVNGAFFTEAPPSVTYILLLLLTMISLFLFDRYRGRAAFILYGVLAAAFIAAWFNAYFFYSLFIPFTYPFLAMTSALIWAVVSHYMAERKERGRVTSIFGRFVPPSVVDEMLASGEEIKVGGQRRDISVIFVDIRGFTPMSERLQPEQVIEVLNEYLDICTKAVFNWNGTLDTFIGDGVMALFGAPVHLPNHPELAVRAALEMKKHSDVLERKCIERFGIGVKFGVGINCGPAVVGNIGSEMLRLDYTAIGDTVNLSARLESNAKPGQILISEEMSDRVGHLFELEDMGEIKVKGKERPVRVFSVLSELDTGGESPISERREGA
ncbi:adenylate/guanylate cyclase domain-containing protein [uncultured Paenibacillus sp.]|uniref:CHASE2 domain-containing protein n=1 Tax=uncultured Paenibacillus sp. TaxID=227322 RepID=UPI0028D64546|nr:adenylate/guanylate cyclase domain-containing protein [uncultured Paenibacillus sp.]